MTLPEMGESVTEGSIVEFRKKPGDFVAEGDPIVDVTTDKVDVEVPAPAAGVITQIFVKEGDTVAVGARLARNRRRRKSQRDERRRAERRPQQAQPRKHRPRPLRRRAAGADSSRPRKRSASRANRISISRCVRGSGPDGLILRERRAGTSWVREAQDAAAIERSCRALPPLRPARKSRRSKARSLRLHRLHGADPDDSDGDEFPHLAVDVMDARRKELNAAIKAAGRTEKVSFTHIIAFALVRAAREMPFITCSFRRDEAARRCASSREFISAWRSIPSAKTATRFLVVPVIKNAGELDFAQFCATVQELVAKARDNKLGADDLSGASFTLTNPGGIGTVASVPRLMAGQGAILAAGAIGYPPGFASANEAALQAARHRKSHADDEHLRSPRHSRRAIGRVSAPRRRIAAGQRRFLRIDLRSARACAQKPRRKRRLLPRRRIAATAIAAERTACTVGRNVARRRRRHGDRFIVSHARASCGACSIRSDPNRSAIPRSIRAITA